MPSATRDLPSLWQDFLSEVDRRLPEPVEVHCLGGFVVTLLYGLTRTTNDVDYIEIRPAGAGKVLQAIAGPTSELSRKHGLHFQHVTVASVPEAYAERLVEPFRGRFGNLRLLVVEAHDLALSKLGRNSPVDRFDVAHLAKTAPLDPEVLQTRYRRELRPGSLVGDPDTHDRTLQMWIESYFHPHR